MRESEVECILPFESPSVIDRILRGRGRCIQGNDNPKGTHTGSLKYAYDFKLPVGSKVLAARSGVVVYTVGHFHEGSLQPALLPRANFIAIYHEEGDKQFYTRYFHLQLDGVLIEQGAAVQAGCVIGLSGNTGYSAGPHLHFDAVNFLPEHSVKIAFGPDEGDEFICTPASFSGTLPFSQQLVLLIGENESISCPPEYHEAPKAILVNRTPAGSKSFAEIVTEALDSNAKHNIVLVVVANCVRGPELFQMGGAGAPPVGCVMVSHESGLKLREKNSTSNFLIELIRMRTPLPQDWDCSTLPVKFVENKMLAKSKCQCLIC
jgi:hypothetical protein